MENKHAQDIQRLQNNIAELEKLDIDFELDAHDKLLSWNEFNNKITALNKKKAH